MNNSDFNYNRITNVNQIQNGISNNSLFNNPFQVNPLLTNSFNSLESLNNNFFPDYSVPKLPSRHYTFDHERSVGSEIIDINETKNDYYKEDLDKNIEKPIRRVNKSENDDRNGSNRNLRKYPNDHFKKAKYKSNNINRDNSTIDENIIVESNIEKENLKKSNKSNYDFIKNSNRKSNEKNIKIKEYQTEFENNNKSHEKSQIQNKIDDLDKEKKLADNDVKSEEEIEIIRDELKNFNKKFSTVRNKNDKLRSIKSYLMLR